MRDFDDLAAYQPGHELVDFVWDNRQRDLPWRGHMVHDFDHRLVSKAYDTEGYVPERGLDEPICIYLTMRPDVRRWFERNVRGDWSWGFQPFTYLLFRDAEDAERFRAAWGDPKNGAPPGNL